MNFKSAVDVILEREGGLVDHPRDPGGITNFGISLRAYPHLGADGIRNLTREDAVKIYRRDYWLKASCGKFPKGIRLFLFDSAVNQGVIRAIKILQRTLHVKADGIVGPKTLAASKKYSSSDLAAHYLTDRLSYYRRSRNWKTFGKGWTRRLFHLALES